MNRRNLEPAIAQLEQAARFLPEVEPPSKNEVVTHTDRGLMNARRDLLSLLTRLKTMQKQNPYTRQPERLE